MTKQIRSLMTLLLAALLVCAGIPALAAEQGGEPASTAGGTVAGDILADVTDNGDGSVTLTAPVEAAATDDGDTAADGGTAAATDAP